MNDKHGHSLRYVRIVDSPNHFHSYDTQTTVFGHHRHRLSGRTSLPQGSGDRHVHYYEGTTSFNDGHVHEYSGWTGPPISLPNGNHYHEFSGQTTYDDGHIHYYRGATSEGIV
ncbi:YmaF family protein [Brevibacillus reuszeri]|uniref:YmaF family protein n=1 Tax=Brevibacillus reuszeri TaxID=54915 RepID=UPI0028A03874|nr:YmaF family protein [Brevibacillus reuszeri]